MARWIGVALLLALALAALQTQRAHPVAAPAAKAPIWTVRFYDHFEGPWGSLPDRSRWRFDLGHGRPAGPPDWGTREVEAYTQSPANIMQDGHGHLLIVPRRDAHGDWTSARIETQSDDFKPPPGGILHVESRIRMPDVSGPAALGYWPAFWMLGAPERHGESWPAMGEFDIMENVNGIDAAWGTLHCGVYPGGPCNEPLGLSAEMRCPGQPCRAAFHTYVFEWDEHAHPAQLRWYLDGVLYHRIDEDELPPATWQAMTGHAGFFILLDLAIGGSFADTLSGQSFGRHPGDHLTPTAQTQAGYPLVIDYVGVWTHAASTFAPATATATATATTASAPAAAGTAARHP